MSAMYLHDVREAGRGDEGAVGPRQRRQHLHQCAPISINHHQESARQGQQAPLSIVGCRLQAYCIHNVGDMSLTAPEASTAGWASAAARSSDSATPACSNGSSLAAGR
jgi:hypothetical protein